MTGLVHVPPDDEHPASGMLWLGAAERARTLGLPVAVAAIDPVIGSAMRRASDALPVFDWTMPLDGTPKSHYRPQIASVGFLGHQREERGSLLIPPLARALLDTGYKVFIHDTIGQFQLQTAIPNLVLVNGFVRELAAVMVQCDLVVCYQEQTVPAVLDAVGRSRLDYPRRCQAAQHAALDWQQTRGVEKFVDAVLAALPSPTQSAPG